MGVYNESMLVFGARVERKCDTKFWTETKYDEDTGEKYEKEFSDTVCENKVVGTDVVVEQFPETFNDDDFDEDFYINNTIVTGYDSIEFVGFACATAENGEHVTLGVPDFDELNKQLRTVITPYFSPEDVKAIMSKANLHLLHRLY